ncbi:hypothetical protein ACSU1N_03995 [Thermogladius sp. 4427co]|uniref:hypothetical protein n=1 Tax=Thermogladius sp. 4427co TaxID=3450718 RepID=UPI003F7A7A56
MIPLAYSSQTPRIIYVSTDPYDYRFITDLVRTYPDLNGTIIGLDEVGSYLSEGDIIVLTDPNWVDPSTGWNASEQLYGFVLRGGVVVATLNGLVLLHIALETRGLSRISDCPTALAASIPGDYPGYELGKYKAVCVESLFTIRDVFPETVLNIGRGYIVATGLNLVWAYVDTSNRKYLDAMRDLILESLQYSNRGGGSQALAGAAAVVAVVGSAASTQLKNARGRSIARKPMPLPPLWMRLEEGGAV